MSKNRSNAERADRAARILRTEILMGHRPLGQRLREVDVRQKHYCLSPTDRSAARSALSLLARDGLWDPENASVVDLRQKDLLRTVKMRISAEQTAAIDLYKSAKEEKSKVDVRRLRDINDALGKLAGKIKKRNTPSDLEKKIVELIDMDINFHREIVTLARYEPTISTLRVTHHHLILISPSIRKVDRHESIVAEHDEIIEALLNGEDAIRNAYHKHLVEPTCSWSPMLTPQMKSALERFDSESKRDLDLLSVNRKKPQGESINDQL